MKQLITAQNLETFMLRLDRVAPAACPSTAQPESPGSGEFALLLAAATVAAHLDFAANLDPAAAPAAARRRIQDAIRALRRQAWRFKRSLILYWLSRTLSLSSKSKQEALDGVRAAYGQALRYGHTLLSLAVPCSTGWYDETTDKRQIEEIQCRRPAAQAGRAGRHGSAAARGTGTRI
jgi:hypothetical protein